MTPRPISPSSYVGLQVAHFRARRGWSQQQLADRLGQLGMGHDGWSQTKVAKLETGRLARVNVDDLFAIAIALDVSPLYLVAPLDGFDRDGRAYKVLLGNKMSRWPRDVRAWVRGVRPLLHNGDYATDEEARSGKRFYLLESQPLSEWLRIVEAGRYAERVLGSLEMLTPDDEEEK